MLPTIDFTSPDHPDLVSSLAITEMYPTTLWYALARWCLDFLIERRFHKVGDQRSFTCSENRAICVLSISIVRTIRRIISNELDIYYIGISAHFQFKDDTFLYEKHTFHVNGTSAFACVTGGHQYIGCIFRCLLWWFKHIITRVEMSGWKLYECPNIMRNWMKNGWFLYVLRHSCNFHPISAMCKHIIDIEYSS